MNQARLCMAAGGCIALAIVVQPAIALLASDCVWVPDQILALARGTNDQMRLSGFGLDCNSQQGSYIGNCSSASVGQPCMVCDSNPQEYEVHPMGTGPKLRYGGIIYCSGPGTIGICQPLPGFIDRYYCDFGDEPNTVCNQGAVAHYDLQPEDP